MMYDIIIKSGMVYDGISTTPFKADIAIGRDTIVEIGDLSNERAEIEIDAFPRPCHF